MFDAIKRLKLSIAARNQIKSELRVTQDGYSTIINPAVKRKALVFREDQPIYCGTVSFG